jgi:hypothetical protein
MPSNRAMLLYPPCPFQHRLAGDLSAKDPLLITLVMGPPCFPAKIRRRSHPGQDDDVLALDFYVYVLELRFRPGSLLAGEQRSVNRPAALYQ